MYGSHSKVYSKKINCLIINIFIIIIIIINNIVIIILLLLLVLVPIIILFSPGHAYVHGERDVVRADQEAVSSTASRVGAARRKGG